MSSTTIIYGPQACGKTTHTVALLRRFNAYKVVDDWCPRQHRLIDGAVHLTTATLHEIGDRRCAVISFADLKGLGEPETAHPSCFVRARANRSYR